MLTATHPLHIAEALHLVLVDKRKETDATFVHSPAADSTILHDDLLCLLADMQKGGKNGPLLLNGASAEDFAKEGFTSSYPDFDELGRRLVGMGVDHRNIRHIAPAMNTAKESWGFVQMASIMGWRSATVVALPHHILRCMLSTVAELERANYHLNLYARTLETVDWGIPTRKCRANEEQRAYFYQIEEEFNRIEKYRARAEGSHTPHAEIGELIRHIQDRD
jgi:hypothetical protein